MVACHASKGRVFVELDGSRVVLDELFIGEAAGLWKTVHAFTDFEEDAPIDDETCK